MTDETPCEPVSLSVDDLGSALRAIVEFLDPGGWGQPPMLFALVRTSTLAATQPDLVDPDDDSVLSPIAQDPLTSVSAGPEVDAELERVLATTAWPPMVVGAALIREIVVLPPGTDGDLDTQPSSTHPDRRTARLVVGALRDGPSLSLLHLRPEPATADTETSSGVELLTHRDLATDLRTALAHTFAEPED